MSVQKITANIVDGEKWRLHVVIVGECDDTAAEATRDWAAKEFDIDDLFGSVALDAQVTVTLNGETDQMTGADFYQLDMAGTLTDEAQIAVTFEEAVAADA